MRKPCVVLMLNLCVATIAKQQPPGAFSFTNDACVRQMVSEFNSNESPIKKWLYECWQFKLRTCTKGHPRTWCSFDGYPCLWSNMPPHKLLFIVSLAHALGVTHIVETGRKGAATTFAYDRLGFKVTSIELTTIENVAQTLRALAPNVTLLEGDGNKLVPGAVSALSSSAAATSAAVVPRVAVVIDGPKGPPALTLAQTILNEVAFVAIDDVGGMAPSSLTSETVLSTHPNAFFTEDPRWYTPGDEVADTNFLRRFKGYASCNTQHVTGKWAMEGWARQQVNMSHDATYYLGSQGAAIIPGGKWKEGKAKGGHHQSHCPSLATIQSSFRPSMDGTLCDRVKR